MKIDKGQFGPSEPHKSLNPELLPVLFIFLLKQGKQQKGTPKTDLRTVDMLVELTPCIEIWIIHVKPELSGRGGVKQIYPQLFKFTSHKPIIIQRTD